ncbi:hypothetical protein TGAM01_v201661 [Trichoderma gamsii]|uniref:Uncharacterized protein n=1 Tax=Trichoderma gamsii TaxID=398673 RepID=A0A2P4ZYN8_9HYPO|nr:hypothetical protein TGAM01_v201661 [Trichoderma gamsii]PON29412.1 hypothetical protein TGAM01_v201661 [Trichoderma gamsii]
MTEMQELSDKLHSVLKITEEAPTGSPSAYLADSVDRSDSDATEDRAQWREFDRFMDKQAKERPYPKYLYRAHVHGHPFPRLPDVFEGDSDSFGSDYHLWCENNAVSPILVPIDDPMDISTVEDFFYELSLHLGKTSFNLPPRDDDEQPFRSSLVSLSGDFCWTTQRICRIGRITNKKKDQLPGLAIFKSSTIGSSGVRVWRVEDMLSYLDKRLGKNSVHISPDLRRWATNADEFVCWSLVPRDALVAFTPLPGLIKALDGRKKAFLTKEFVDSNYLGDFRRLPLVHISRREYADRASEFVRNIITNVSSLEEAKQLCMHMKEVLSNPYTWGYEVARSVKGLDEAISGLWKQP